VNSVAPEEAKEIACYFINGVSCYEVARDFAGPALTAFAVIVSVFIAFRQLSLQHNNALLAQKEEAKRDTKIELFKEIDSILGAVGAVVREVNIFCLSRLYPAPGVEKELTHEDYERESYKLNQSLLGVVSKVESNEIIHPRLFKAFRYSLQAIVHDTLALRFARDRELALSRLYDLSSDAQSYLYDFHVCFQNLAYGRIFDTELSPRSPADKSKMVLTNDLEQIEVFLRYFEVDSEWGKRCREQEAAAVERYRS